MSENPSPLTPLAKGRLWLYVACLASAGMAAMQLGTFDVLTGDVTVKPFNLYELLSAASGFIASATAIASFLFGWKVRK